MCVGSYVGSPVGTEVATSVTASVFSIVGICVGSTVGSAVGSIVGAGVAMQRFGSVESGVKPSKHSQIAFFSPSSPIFTAHKVVALSQACMPPSHGWKVGM
jgi:hypothetical protein